MKTFLNFSFLPPLFFILCMFLSEMAISQDFVNGDFESSSSCDPDDCNDDQITCIDDWWDYDNLNSTEFAWYEYLNCIIPIECEDIGKRGVYLQSSGNFSDFSVPDKRVATSNPVFGANPNAVYKLDFDLIGLPLTNPLEQRQPYLSVYGSHYPVAGNGYTHLKMTDSPTTGCTHFTLYFDHGITGNDPKITDFEYLIFESDFTGIPPSPAETNAAVPRRGILDNVTICKAMEFEVLDDCADPCIKFSYYEDCFKDECEEDCVLQLVAFNDQNTYFSYDEEQPLFSIEDCFEIPENIESFNVALYSSHGNLPDGFNLRYNHVLAECAVHDITVNTTWGTNSPPPSRHFELLTIKSGTTLTINSDLSINFCKDGRLIIEPNARLNLYGTLTSNCADYWKGVEVHGDGTTNQFPNNITGAYAQGILYCYTGSKIENAQLAVQLWGPEYSDAGGQIYADGCTFLNNSQGLNFAPFDNFLLNLTRPRPYFSSIRNCEFKIESDYLSPYPFTHHVFMHGIQGINLNGNKYINDLVLDGVELRNKYGFGIFAMGSGFNVGSTAANPINEPCLPPCNPLNKSQFKGLGIGIFSGRMGENKPFQVWSSEFENCNVGIDVQGVDGFNIIFNDFEFGNVKEWNNYEDQIGIYLSSYMRRIAIEENSFYLNGEVSDHTLGIVVDQVGPENNAIRRNTFEDIEIANEAFGLNAFQIGEALTGLHYLCNTNITVEDKDFFVNADALYPINRIRRSQGLFTATFTRAAGNKFSTTGDVDDGDFANYGNQQIAYFYDAQNSNETPIDYFGISDLFPSADPICEPRYCLRPCIDDSQISGVISSFYNSTESYEQAIFDEESQLARYFWQERDSSISLILNFLEDDTSNFNLDTLRKWYLRDHSIASDLILAGNYFYTGDFTNMNKTLDSIYSRFNLESSQAFDISRVKHVYSILSSRSIYSLTNTDIDSLRVFSESIGASSNLARNVLAMVDTFYMPRYYIPGELNPRSTDVANSLKENGPITLSPNPTTGLLNINYFGEIPSEIWIMTTNGELVGKHIIYKGMNNVVIEEKLPNGLYIYTINQADLPIAQGRFVLIR